MATEAEIAPCSCILHTISLPTFDPSTHQLTLSSHHLLSSQLSCAPSFPGYKLLLTSPPLHPYQAPASAPSDPGAPTSRRKRRRFAQPQEATPADWALQRDKQSKKTSTDLESEEHHQSIVLQLEGAVEAVRSGWEADRKEGEGWMGETKGRVEWVEKEAEGREELDLVGLELELAAQEEQEESAEKPIAEPLLLSLSAQDVPLPFSDLFDRIIHNPSSSSPLLLRTSNPSATLHLPPSSAFLLSDFNSWSPPSSGISSFGAKHGGWDFLLLDPPWPNASANRAATYDTFDAYDLWKLDLPALLGSNKPCLVAVWLTNKVKYRRLLLDKLFPSWGINGPLAEWYWIKISTSSGEPVWSLESSGRRCYEGLVLGYHNPTSAPLPSPELPSSKIFLSTPLGHSRKPVITELLRPFLPPTPNVLELFARTTLAGLELTGEWEEERKRGVWLSVGNEAVKFNVVDEEEGEVKGWVRENGTSEEDAEGGVGK